MPPPLHKLLRLDARTLRLLLEAQWELVRAAWRVRRHPIGTLAERARAASAGGTGDVAVAEEIAENLGRAARHGVIRPACLVRALALRAQLERHGIEGAQIRVGVRRASGEFQAHAWVRWNDRILGDDPRHVAGFTEVDDLRVLGPQ